VRAVGVLGLAIQQGGGQGLQADPAPRSENARPAGAWAEARGIGKDPRALGYATAVAMR